VLAQRTRNGHGGREGPELVLDERGVSVPEHPEGNWIGTTVFEGVTPRGTRSSPFSQPGNSGMIVETVKDIGDVGPNTEE